MKDRPMLHLQPEKQLWEIAGPGSAQIVRAGAAMDVSELPFAVDPQGPPLPRGKVTFVELTSGHYWIIAGGFDSPYTYFAGAPIGG
jgi:hypothetical protein